MCISELASNKQAILVQCWTLTLGHSKAVGGCSRFSRRRRIECQSTDLIAMIDELPRSKQRLRPTCRKRRRGRPTQSYSPRPRRKMKSHRRRWTRLRLTRIASTERYSLFLLTTSSQPTSKATPRLKTMQRPFSIHINERSLI